MADAINSSVNASRGYWTSDLPDELRAIDPGVKDDPMSNDEEDPKIYDCEVRGPNGDAEVVRVSTGSFEWSNSDGPIAFYTEGKPLQAGIPIELHGQPYTLSRILAEAEPSVDRDFADYEKPDGQRG